MKWTVPVKECFIQCGFLVFSRSVIFKNGNQKLFSAKEVRTMILIISELSIIFFLVLCSGAGVELIRGRHKAV